MLYLRFFEYKIYQSDNPRICLRSCTPQKLHVEGFSIRNTKLIYSGRNSSVYRAFDETVGEDGEGRSVIVKVVPRARLSALKAEAACHRCTGLSSPFVYRVEEKFCDDPSSCAMVMEDCGLSLSAYFATPEGVRARKDKHRLFDISRRCLLALESVHAVFLLHGDVSPGNFLIDSSGFIRITDYGPFVESGASDDKVFGTPPFLSPSGISRTTLCAEGDGFAVASVIFWVYTNEKPFDVSDLVDWFKDKAPKRLPSLHKVDKRFRPVLRGLWCRNLTVMDALAMLDGAVPSLTSGSSHSSVLSGSVSFRSKSPSRWSSVSSTLF